MQEIYIPLLNEGTDAWRPAMAEHIAGELYKVLENNEIPNEEEWKFKPGNIVKCKTHSFAGGTTGLIAYEQNTKIT